MYSQDNGQTFSNYSLFSGSAWLEEGALTGRVQNWRIQGKSDTWGTIAFKAPYTGTLGIYYNGGCTADSDVEFKILHNSQKIYPIGMEFLSVKKGSEDIREYTTEAGTTILCLPQLTLSNPEEYTDKWAEGIKVDVKAGDYIYLMARSENSGSLIAYTRGFEFKYDSCEKPAETSFEVSELINGRLVVTVKPNSLENARVFVAVKDIGNNISNAWASEEKVVDKNSVTTFEFENLAKESDEKMYVYVWDLLNPFGYAEQVD